jgi:hypothetical protein
MPKYLTRPKFVVEYHMVYEPTNIRKFECHEDSWEEAVEKLYFNFSRHTIVVLKDQSSEPVEPGVVDESVEEPAVVPEVDNSAEASVEEPTVASEADIPAEDSKE